MDAITFIKERSRMCQSVEYCDECPAHIDGECYVGGVLGPRSPETQVRIVEEWSFKNPNKTRQSEILKQFPKARVDVRGVLDICPKYFIEKYPCPKCIDGGLLDCTVCRKEYWLFEIE